MLTRRTQVSFRSKYDFVKGR